MLYFRFDNSKEDFKGENHKSVLYGDSAYDMAYIELVDNENGGEYTKRIKEAFQKEFDGEIEDCIDIVESIVNEFIENEWTLNGCSCFELSADGLKSAENYGHIVDREIITIFEGTKIELGHDDEVVAHCDKIVFQGDAKAFRNILFDLDVEDDTTYEEKLERIMKLIEK